MPDTKTTFGIEFPYRLGSGALSIRKLTRAIMCVAALASWAVADDTLYRYEGDVLPFDESAGWVIFDECIPPCSESVENGHFVLRWPQAGDRANYHLWIAQFGVPPPPPSLWVEWRFRSNHPLGQNFFTCDGSFKVQYEHVSDTVEMYGDAVIQFSGANFVLGLDLNEFHTLRFESLDGNNYRISVDGRVFIVATEFENNGGTSFLQMRGEGGCDGFPNTVNEWDFVRYGTIAFGEQVIATDPPAGTLVTPGSIGIDRFTVTFDSANYVYIDDITVSVTGGPVPVVTKTRRLDNDEPDTVEIVLDRGLSVGQTTTFTLTDGVATNVVAYTLVPDPDDDGDGVFNTQDNCPTHANPDQADCDNDGTGDVCTIAECTADPACADCDVNGKPDACDPDDDADGTIDACDGCPTDPNKTSPGPCGCGTPDTDTDTDLDTILDCNDNCPTHANPNQADCDSDGTGDVCTIAECTGDPACADCDLNTKPDACDPDIDADGTINACDGCPTHPNKTSPGQCGCGIADDDTDLDTIPDCNDRCPGEDDLIDRNTNGQPDCLEDISIPTLSTWGMVTLALLLIAVARRVYRRQVT